MWTFVRLYGIPLLITAVIGYLLGSINWAIIITKLFSRKDIRQVGSGNAGATNVLRSQGVVPAVLTSLGDLGKSMLAAAVGIFLMTHAFPAPADAYLAQPVPAAMFGTHVTVAGIIGGHIGGLFCVLGHLLPVFYGFRGGKGVLTFLGMYVVLDWRMACIALALFIVLVALSRMVSLGSVMASSYVPLLTLVLRGWVDGLTTPTVIFCMAVSTIITAIVVCKHGTNMRRILSGTERRIGEDKEAES